MFFFLLLICFIAFARDAYLRYRIRKLEKMVKELRGK